MMRALRLWICVCLATSLAAPSPQQLGLDIIDLAAISRMSPKQLEMLAEGLAAEEIMRTKRSSAQALSSVVSKASSASSLGSKIGLLGQASSGALAFITSASSKSGNHEEHPGYSYEPQEPKVDFWGLKKSILYTLLQAVKAITGGVTILKGQLIKGGGHLASTLGKVIAVKGEAVSNLGKKIVSSAALSQKKPHAPPVYGPPAHIDYPPSAYGAPTAPAQYHSAPTQYHTAPSAPTGFASHKYPSHLDELIVMSSVVDDVVSDPPPPPYPSQELTDRYYDLISALCVDDTAKPRRGKLNGVHAGLVILTPLEDGSTGETHHTSPAHTGHTPLEPPTSILHTAFSAIKNVFSSVAPSLTATHNSEPHTYQPPPPQIPSFKPMAWDAVNSYGEPAMVEAYPDYDPRNPHPPFNNYASNKKSVAPRPVPVIHNKGLTSDKIQKISYNLNKIAAYMNENIQRSSEEHPKLTAMDVYRDMLVKGELPLLPTPVVTDNEIGVLPADLLPSEPLTTTTSTTTTTTTTTTEKPTTTTESQKDRRKKDVKYILRGNRIVLI